MTSTNTPTDVITKDEKELLKDLDENQRRKFLAVIAQRNGKHGVGLVCKTVHVNRKTIYRGMHELEEQVHIEEGRIRKPGGGRKCILAEHPEYREYFTQIVEYSNAGLPQDADTKWLRLSPLQIQCRYKEDYHVDVSLFTVRQVIRAEGYTRRKPLKSIPMAECKDRDAQFTRIEQLRKEQVAACQPIISIDTKKKEIVGNFRRGDGRAYTQGIVNTFDHDFESFAEGKIVPYGIYDVIKNTGYMTFGISHDTAEFACNCIKAYWERILRIIYPHAKTILVLCDGGGSNSARGWLFKYCLIRLANDIGVDIRVAHYPQYCSKWNPIEHRLFSQISKAWEGAGFHSVEEAEEMAAGVRTKTGLAVFTSIDRRQYETNKECVPSFEQDCKKYIVHDESLSKWNYLVKCK